MPVLVHGRGVRRFWSGKKSAQRPAPMLKEQPRHQSDEITIALINNMPDSALEDTEFQFFDLLNHASGANTVHIKLFSLPNIPRVNDWNSI